MAEKIKVGFPVPLSGTYGTEAKEQLTAAELAVDEFNASGGLDGREAEIVVRDTKLLKELAQSSAEELCTKEKVHVMVGALKSEDMVEISKICAKHGILYNAISQSDTILEIHNRRRSTFHEGWDFHMGGGAIGRYAFSHYGNRVAVLSGIQELGEHFTRALLHVGTQIGVDFIYNDKHPVGCQDFRPFLKRIQELKPEVLVFNCFGADQLNAVKQSRELGIFEDTRIVLANFSVTQRMIGGADVFEGVVGACGYYWRLEEKFASAKEFNKNYRARSGGVAPTTYSAFGYVGTKTVLTAIQRAKTLETEKLVREMLAMRFDFCRGPQFYRGLDHQSVQPVVIVESKSESDMQSPDDFFEILEVNEFLGPRTFLVSRETV